MDNLFIKFKIDHQIISRIDKNKLVSGSQRYVRARFSFSEDWNDATKVAIFKTGAYPLHVLLEDDECEVPWEVLQSDGIIEVSVFGNDENGVLSTVNSCQINIEKSGYCNGFAGVAPTPSVYEQILERLAMIEATLNIEKIKDFVKEDIKELNIVTKDDINGLIEDYIVLKDYATHDDINDVADTRLVSKNDFTALEARVATLEGNN